MMKTMEKRNFIQFVAGMTGYSILLGVSMSVIDSGNIEPIWQYMFALLPLLPFSVALSAIISTVRNMDELQKQIQLEAILYAALITGAIATCLGLLEANELIAHLPIIWIPAAMILIWGTASALIARRYG